MIKYHVFFVSLVLIITISIGHDLSRFPANLFSAYALGKSTISPETSGVTKTLITIAKPQSETVA